MDQSYDAFLDNILSLSPPPPHTHTTECFAKIFRMIVWEYEQIAVHKRYIVVGNGPDSVLETSGAIYRVN